jgi:heterodisulfide reductase subunit D
VTAPNRSNSDLLAEVMATPGGERVGTCYQCATCSGSCPTATAMDYTPRALLHMIRLGMGERVLHSRAIWLCTTCYSCTIRCPREIKITDAMVSLRSLAIAKGVQVPENLVRLKDTVSTNYNISGDDNDTRLIWSENLDEEALVFQQKREAEVLFFVGCVAAFYPMVYGIPQALAQVMLAADVDFATLGGEEWCCGYPLFSAGMEEQVVPLMKHNIERVKAMGAKTVVTTCPSCYHTWEHIYPRLDSSPLGFEVLHASQFLAQLMEGRKLKLKNIEDTATYHDPCDLGRKSGVYDAPRQVIEGIPGLEFREFESSREHALCCGGGGDVQIVDEGVTAAVAARRVHQAKKTGARILLSACQQCKRTLMTAARSEKVRVRVMDIAELVWRAVEG